MRSIGIARFSVLQLFLLAHGTSIKQPRRQPARPKGHRHARALILIPQSNGFLDSVGCAVTASRHGQVAFQNAPLHVHHDASALAQRTHGIVAAKIATTVIHNGIKGIGMILQIVIVRGHRGVEFAALLESLQQDGIFDAVEFAVRQIFQGHIAGAIDEFRIHVTGGDKDESVANADDIFDDHNKAAFEFA